MPRTVLTEEIAEGATPRIIFTILDANDVGFKPTTLALTLYSYRDNSIINSRGPAQNVLDANGVTVSDDGEVIFQLTAGDTAIMHEDSAREVHVALFEWSWGSGIFHGKHEIEHRVRNMAFVGT